MTIKRVLRALALLLVLVILAGGVLYMRRSEQDDQDRMRNLYEEVEPLQQEREALAAERDSLEEEYALKMRDVATVQLLFREMSSDIFTEAYPLMRDHGIIGVLGISLRQYPGLRGRLSVDQYNRLLMDGWGSCLVFEDAYQLDYWLNYMTTLLNGVGVAMPTAIFFPNGTYDSSMDELLSQYGIETVIVNSSDGRSSTVVPVDEGIWHIGAMPWNYTGVNTDTEILARTSGANLSFTISFSDLWDAYEEESFITILDNWVNMLEEDEELQGLVVPTPDVLDPTQATTVEDELSTPLLRFTTFEQAREQHKQAASDNKQLARELERRQTEIDAQIQVLDTQIRALYDEWEQQNKQGA